jgi:hypothetical protein
MMFSPFVEEPLLCAVVERGGSRMHRKIASESVSGLLDLREDRQFGDQVAARVHQGPRQVGHEVIAKLLVRDEIERGSERRQVVGSNRR